MTQHFPTRQLRFYLTAPAPCPYLPQRLERKIFAHLPMTDGATVNDSLTEGGFRRSQNIAYRPACETCSACVSVRIPVADHVAGRSDRKTLNRNADLERRLVEAEATLEQFDLLRRYLRARHADGGMTDMVWPDFVAMIEDTPVRSHLIEYRRRSEDGGPGELVACTLVVEALVLLRRLPPVLLLPAMALHGYVLSVPVFGWSTMPVAAYGAGLLLSQGSLLLVALWLLRPIAKRLSPANLRWLALALAACGTTWAFSAWAG